MCRKPIKITFKIAEEKEAETHWEQKWESKGRSGGGGGCEMNLVLSNWN